MERFEKEKKEITAEDVARELKRVQDPSTVDKEAGEQFSKALREGVTTVEAIINSFLRNPGVKSATYQDGKISIETDSGQIRIDAK